MRPQTLVNFKADISTKALLEMLDKHITVAGFANAQERRDYNFGRIFSIHVLCRAGRMAEVPGDKIARYDAAPIHDRCAEAGLPLCTLRHPVTSHYRCGPLSRG